MAVNPPTIDFAVPGAKVTPKRHDMGAPLVSQEMAQDAASNDALARLMAAAQAGDAQSYRALLGEIAPIVRRIVRRRHPFLSIEDTEDLVQEVLLSVHAVRATYDPSRPFLPWLIAITRHRVGDAARRHVRQKAWEVAVDEYPETFDAAEANPGEADYGDPQALRQAMAGLPEGQRTAIELTKLQELSLKEAAERSGMSVAALKIASHRAIKALRGVLGREAGR
jgi:RNA polymerase sigma factor (sigma-70 family)